MFLSDINFDTKIKVLRQSGKSLATRPGMLGITAVPTACWTRPWARGRLTADGQNQARAARSHARTAQRTLTTLSSRYCIKAKVDFQIKNVVLSARISEKYACKL